MSKLKQLVVPRAQQWMDAYLEHRGRHALESQAHHARSPTPNALSALARGGLDSLVDVVRRVAARGPLVEMALAKVELEPYLYWDREKLLERSALLLTRFPESAAYHFYHGQAAFFLNRLDEAERSLDTALALDPGHADSAYLLADLYRRQGRSEDAWRLLASIAERSARERTWIELANCVDTQEDLARLLTTWNAWPHRKRFNRAIQEYIAVGALRARDYTLAKQLWRDNLAQLQTLGTPSRPSAQRVNYSNLRARAALLDFKHAMDAAQVPFFLVSGTLLGCIRENDLLGHDKDIDVGIWDDSPRSHVISAIQRSGAFRVTPSRSDSMIRIRHANGVAVDVFYHFRDEAKRDYWHEGVKARWHNSPFTLVSRSFLGVELCVPATYERYLEENYGDWKTPKLEFDAVYDTPNSEITNPEELAVHVYKALAAAWLKNKTQRVAFYEQKLRELGEPELTLPRA